MAQQISDKDDVLNEVNVIPLADLSLVLLIILMVMSPMISQALIQVSAARAAAALTQEDLPNEKPETPLIISYEPTALKVNGTPILTDIEFVKRLDELIGARRDKSVIFTAAPECVHGKVVRIMDLIKRHGATELVLVKWDASAVANVGNGHAS